jgi:predicted RNA-binding protein YlxR (DUF448 family)
MTKKKRPTRQKHVPLRTCIACRETKSKRELIRIVLLPDGTVAVDETGKMNGRGAYLCRRHACWQKALERGSLNRALRTSLPPEATAHLTAYAAEMFKETEAADDR